LRRLTAFSKILDTNQLVARWGLARWGLVGAILIAAQLLPLSYAVSQSVKPVLIYNHGTRRPQVRHQCNRDRNIPPVVRVLMGTGRFRLHYLCSRAVDGGEVGSYTYKRAAEIKRVVEKYRSRGVPAKRIFLLGFSAGGWSSLLASRHFGHKFNAVIAFAPAFAGPRHEFRLYPQWRGRIRPRQVAHIEMAASLPSLIFAFPDDSFNRPQDLSFLRRMRGVNLVTISNCQGGHRTPMGRCFAKAAASRIARYIQNRSR
jgi:pimeloyl-ACP methyl ester carboxylesterase